MAEMICTECGTQGQPKKITKGSLGIEVILWICGILPGILYSVWRLSTRYEGCASCGGKVIPANSPKGKQLAGKA